MVSGAGEGRGGEEREGAGGGEERKRDGKGGGWKALVFYCLFLSFLTLSYSPLPSLSLSLSPAPFLPPSSFIHEKYNDTT